MFSFRQMRLSKARGTLGSMVAMSDRTTLLETPSPIHQGATLRARSESFCEYLRQSIGSDNAQLSHLLDMFKR